ncbi:AAA family ATPase [Metabacillus litoralis]|uniref:AAA family ATPase n=1 Tax=Metabacillus litoralis TaxID=152268 RepID=UPI00204061E5|nr:AAA family ATPase [Metabacillus litoralis]MCM3411489.1 ATPase [Metabacillus litoralis]
MQINFKALTLQEFKSHQDLRVSFGEVTKITGDNGKGKSTIPQAISWLLYGTDALGSKLDPAPITYEGEETKVTLLISVDEIDVLLGRGLKKGKVQYYINDVPKKAGEFNDVIDNLFDKDLFLSLYNPNYFPSMHWEKQRELLLRYVTPSPNKEILKHLPEEQGKHLGALLKKHNLSDIERIHRENKTKQDKKHIAAKSKTKTLKDQLDQLPEVNAPLDSLKVELSQIDKQVRELETQYDKAADANREYTKVQSQIHALQDQIDMSKERWPSLKNEVIEDTCRTCKRPLDEESVEAVVADKENRIVEYKGNHTELIKKRDELKAKLDEMEYIDASEKMEQIRTLDSSGQPLREAIQAYSQLERLQVQVNEAEIDEKSILDSLNESIFTLDCIKAFKAKEAELQAEKVQALFTTLSVRLFKQNKGDGEYKPDFEIEMDGKPYSKLSLSEGIRAGLELRDVLCNQSEIVTPVFVDNAESITSFKEPVGQLIMCRVVAGQDLLIEVEETQNGKQ